MLALDLFGVWLLDELFDLVVGVTAEELMPFGWVVGILGFILLSFVLFVAVLFALSGSADRFGLIMLPLFSPRRLVAIAVVFCCC